MEIKRIVKNFSGIGIAKDDFVMDCQIMNGRTAPYFSDRFLFLLIFTFLRWIVNTTKIKKVLERLL